MESMFNLSGSAILVDFGRVYSNRSSLPFSVILEIGQKIRPRSEQAKRIKDIVMEMWIYWLYFLCRLVDR